MLYTVIQENGPSRLALIFFSEPVSVLRNAAKRMDTNTHKWEETGINTEYEQHDKLITEPCPSCQLLSCSASS